MNDNELLKQQLQFFDYIYPTISRQIDELKKEQANINSHVLHLIEEKKYWMETINQYKKKIQRIEQFIIENGLIKLLINKQ